MARTFKRDFKVIIIGAGISGLTFAHLLSQMGLDYQILESHEKVVSEVGGSFGIWPNAARILDQLGLWNEVQQVCKPLQFLHIRRSDGSLGPSTNLSSSIASEYGYECHALERHKYVQVLYNNLQKKHEILTGRRVIDILETEHEVRVFFEDGACRGDIVVGCDGVHSTVRQFMWTKANTLFPGLINAEEKRSLSSSYRCLVGVAPIIAGLEENEMNVTHGKGVSTVLTTQPDTALFFACIKERNKSQWPCRKHFTAADADKEAAQLGDLPVTDNVLFGELWAKRSRGYLCSLEEGILKHWHFGRIALLGDSAHKFSPVGAHGGNCAVESAAALANELNQYWTSQNGPPSSEDIQTIFESYQKSREGRVHMIYDFVHLSTRLGTFDTYAKRFFALYILPWKDGSAAISALLKDAPKVNFIAVPERSKGFSDFEDGIGLRKPQGGALETYWAMMAYIGTTGLACAMICALRSVLLH